MRSAPVEPLNQGDQEWRISQFQPDLRRADPAGPSEAERGDLDAFDWLPVVDRREFGKPERLAVPDIGLGTCAAGTARADERLHLLG